ncbi:hypothetical protein HDU97_001387 [Phlyctochytrium planicorne]|nr:hypothetical protein HDU97_001387 [Phlyctochytrium planicorne]
MRTLDKIKQPVKLRPPKIMRATPCAAEMSTLFNCWRALEVDSPSCASSAQALIACMAKARPAASQSQSIDHVNRQLAKLRQKKQL